MSALDDERDCPTHPCRACKGTGLTTDGLRIGQQGQAMSPGISWCYRCETPWTFVKSHTTQITRTQGCFPLCEQCWSELETPRARMPFYRAMWESWSADGVSSATEWALIEAAVLGEGP